VTNSRLDSQDTLDEFFLQEIQRLAQSVSETFQMYQRQFDIYLAVASAAFVGAIAASEFVVAPALRERLILAILSVVLILGLSIYTSLCDSNVHIAHLELAIRRIQDRFTGQEPQHEHHLYYRHSTGIIAGTRFSVLAFRGITGGGQKSILVLANSAAISVLIVRLLLLSSLPTWAQYVLGLALSVLLALLHVTYAVLMYWLNGLGRGAKINPSQTGGGGIPRLTEGTLPSHSSLSLAGRG
jgi:hypothetical protein